MAHKVNSQTQHTTYPATMDDCSYNSGSCSTANTTQQPHEEAPSRAKENGREKSVVFWARLVVLAAITISAAALGVAVFRAASREEQDVAQIQVSNEPEAVNILVDFVWILAYLPYARCSFSLTPSPRVSSRQPKTESRTCLPISRP